MRQINYDAADLRFSDHHPVYATFQCTVSIIDEEALEILSRAIYEKRRADVGNSTANGRSDETEDEDLIGYEPVEPGLPPASSDRRKWWLDNGQPARTTIQPPNGTILNPSRPSNPFTPTDEPDWVTLPRRRDSYYEDTTNPSYIGNATVNSRKENSLNGNGQKSSPLRSLSGPGARSSQRAASDEARPRANSVLSNNSSHSSRKPAPPIAKKPVHLTGSPSLSASGSSPEMNKTPHPGLRKVNGSALDGSAPAPPSRRATSGSSAINGIGLGVLAEDPGLPYRAQQTPPKPPQARRSNTRKSSTDSQGPKLPPRPTQPPTTDLLTDGGDEAGFEWEVLKPT